MITLEKTIIGGEALNAIVAMQSEYTSLAQIKDCAKYFSDSHDSEYQAIAIFNDGTMLRITDNGNGEGLQYNNEFDSDFVTFVLKVVASYKGMDLCFEFDTLLDLFSIVENFGTDQNLLLDLLISDYWNYDIGTLVNYVENSACIFEGSSSDYAYELIEDCYDTKSMGTLANYIDYEAFARDLELNGEIQELAYNVYWTNPNDIY
jgi:hypothetical protein